MCNKYLKAQCVCIHMNVHRNLLQITERMYIVIFDTVKLLKKGWIQLTFPLVNNEGIIVRHLFKGLCWVTWGLGVKGHVRQPCYGEELEVQQEDIVFE